MNARTSIRIELTVDQQQQLRAAFGSQVSSLELDLAELEARIAPGALTSAVSDVTKSIGQALQSAARG